MPPPLRHPPLPHPPLPDPRQQTLPLPLPSPLPRFPDTAPLAHHRQQRPMPRGLGFVIAHDAPGHDPFARARAGPVVVLPRRGGMLA